MDTPPQDSVVVCSQDLCEFSLPEDADGVVVIGVSSMDMKTLVYILHQKSKTRTLIDVFTGDEFVFCGDGVSIGSSVVNGYRYMSTCD